MDDSGPAVRILGRPRKRRRIIALLTAALALISVCSAIAQTPAPLDNDAARKIAKRARRLTRAESLTEAEKLLRDTVATNPGSGELKTELAYVLAKRRKLREAYDLVYTVCEAEPKNARAFAVLGYVLLSAGRFVDARPFFYTALKIDRRQHLGWAGMGMLDFYENRISASLENLNNALYEAPNEPDYYYTVAQVNARAENFRQAAEAYDQFLNVSSSTDADRRARIRGLIAFLRYIGQKGKLYRTAGDRETIVNFQLEGNRPVITVKVNNDARPLRFILDTGSGITVISQETAKRLRVKSITKGGFAKGIGGTGRFEIVYGFLRSIDIGAVSVRDVPVYIRRFHSEQGAVDGYIGLAMISKFLTTIDYGTNTFSLMRRDDPRAAADPAELQLPLRLTSSGFLSGQVQIEGIDPSLNFIVDTGASVSVISEGVAANDAMTKFATTDRLRVVGSAGVKDGVQTFLLPKLTFGPHSQQQVQAIALDLDLINEATGFEQAGILGGNFLRNYRLTFDFKNSKVNFTPVVPAVAR